MNRLLRLLQSSEKPIILLGAGSWESADKIIAFAEIFNIPILTTWNAIGVIDYNHPNFIGRPGIVACRGANLSLQTCDLLLSVGARLDLSTIAFKYNKFASRAKKVLVDIDKAEGSKIPNLDLFIQEDALKFIEELSSYQIGNYKSWLRVCHEWKIKYPSEGTTTTYELCNVLSDALTPEDIIVFSNSGMTGGAIFPAFFRQKKGQRIIMSSCGLGSMGSGISSAIGVALASRKKIICIDGDGSFMQNVQELEVIRRLNLPIIFFVVNNGGYASIRDSETRAFKRVSGADFSSGLTLPSIKKIAGAFDITAVDYVCDAINVYLNQPFPLVVEVHAPKDEVLIPRVMFDGRGTLEDMYPYLDNGK